MPQEHIETQSCVQGPIVLSIVRTHRNSPLLKAFVILIDKTKGKGRKH